MATPSALPDALRPRPGCCAPLAAAVVYPCDAESLQVRAVRRVRRLPRAGAGRAGRAHPRRRRRGRARRRRACPSSMPRTIRAQSVPRRTSSPRAGEVRGADPGQRCGTRTCSRRSRRPTRGLRTERRLSHVARSSTCPGAPGAAASPTRSSTSTPNLAAKRGHRAEHDRRSRSALGISEPRRRACSRRSTSCRRRSRRRRMPPR